MRAVGSDAPALDRVDRTRVSVAVGPLLGPVLTRVVGIHASRADLPVDRLNDAVLVADAVAAQAPGSAVDGRVAVSLLTSSGRLELRIGPLQAGGGQRVLERAALPSIGSVIERLADGVRVRSAAGGDEYLVIRIDGDPDGAGPSGA